MKISDSQFFRCSGRYSHAGLGIALILLFAGCSDDTPGDNQTTDERDAGEFDDAGDANSLAYALQAIETSGFTAIPGSCRGISDGQMKLRFVLADDENMPIRPSVMAVELSADSIALSNSALHKALPRTCDSAEDCGSNALDFQCGLAPGLADAAVEGNLQSCHVPEPKLSLINEAGAVDFVADVEHDQVYGVLMESTGGLNGWSLPGTEGAWDANGDGDTGDAEDLPPYGVLYGDPIASDPEKKRVQGLLGAHNTWVNAHELAQDDQRNTYFGLWSFNALNAAATSHIAETGQPETSWTTEAAWISRALNDYQSIFPQRSRANVYEAILNVIESSYSDEALSNLDIADPASVDKQLVVFVDGYDDMRENDATGIDEVIQAAVANQVRVFIVHLDPAFEEPEQIREDPDYWRGQTPCLDDDACKNYETCRKPRGYAPTTGEPVMPVEGADQTYCLPKRDAFGRVGPIADYARLACATEGGYLYVPSADGVTRSMSWTPLALDGLWEATVNSGELQGAANLGGIPLMIQTDMTITLGEQSRTYSFSRIGETANEAPSDPSGDAFDTRSVVFTAE
jgi:hypothetical protein